MFLLQGEFFGKCFCSASTRSSLTLASSDFRIFFELWLKPWWKFCCVYTFRGLPIYTKGVAIISFSKCSDPGIPNVYVSSFGVGLSGWVFAINNNVAEPKKLGRFQETSGNSAWEDVWVWAPQQLFTWKEVISNRLCWNGPMLKNTTLSDFAFEIAVSVYPNFIQFLQRRLASLKLLLLNLTRDFYKHKVPKFQQFSCVRLVGDFLRILPW